MSGTRAGTRPAVREKTARRTARRSAGVGVAVAAVVAGLAVTASAGDAARPDALQRDVDAIGETGAVEVLAQAWGEDGLAEEARSDASVDWRAHYRIGSVSKTFTSTVALQLVGEGRLSLDDTVERWLPGAVRGHGNDGDRITVTNLLRQTSGLQDYDEQLPWVEDFTTDTFHAERFRAYQPEELLALATSRPPSWLPDLDDPASETRWEYSNTNYLLAGLVIEEVTGRPLAQEIHARVIEPLGLEHTYFAGGSAHVPSPRMTGWTQFPGEEELVDTTVFTPFPDATLISTTQDVAAFYRALLGGELLPDEQLAQLRETVEARDMWNLAPGAHYGLGIYWRPADGCDEGVWYHGGTMPGYQSHVAATPDGGRAVAVATATWRPADERQDQQDTATLELVDNALCGASG